MTTLPLKTLGQTGIQVSPIGLGTVKFGRNQAVKYPRAFELPSDEDIIALLDLAQSLGINTLDTAPAYGSSEQRLGKLLAGQREDWVIVGKAGETFIDGQSHYQFDADFIQKSVEQSLRRLHTDYIDVLLIHSNGDDMAIIERDEVFTTLDQLKQRGLIRATGMSTKTVAGGLCTIEHADVAMVTYNPIHQDEKPVIDAACAADKGILIKKALASGHLDKIAKTDALQASMDFVLQTPGVSSIILGTINPAHLKQNVHAAWQALT